MDMSTVDDHSRSWPSENVVPPLEGHDPYRDDPLLQEMITREGAGWAHENLQAEGRLLVDDELRSQAREADRYPPRLERYDAVGRRIDRVVFHPAWHVLLGSCIRAGLHARAWHQKKPGAHVARAASYLLHARIDAATLCPTTMTFAAIPLLERETALWPTIGHALVGEHYDPTERPLKDKTSGLVGMGLTEIQGGSDLKGVTTRAAVDVAADNLYRLHGRKWFLSVPQSDAHLVLARESDERLSCFYVPRHLPDGSRNAVVLERLKDKLGNRGNATAEAIYEGAIAIRVGEPGRGLSLLMEMATSTRLDNVLGSAALLREGLVQALHHARHRRAFGARLVDQPLMKALLIDVALESAAATALAVHLAALVDSREKMDAVARRLLIPASKYWVTKRTIALLGECLEVLGGNGYVEDGSLARLYREAPVNSIWEGSGNVMLLDVLRAIRKDPSGVYDWFASLERESAGDSCLESLARRLPGLAEEALIDPSRARFLAIRLVLLAQAQILRELSGGVLYAPFVTSRFSSESWGIVGGLVTCGSEGAKILNAVLPESSDVFS